jgi:putative glutamine amidotransferase
VRFPCQHVDVPDTTHRPVVGVTSYVEDARWGVWDRRAVVLPYAYVEALERVGARVVVVPPSPSGAAALVERLDALVLAGGADLDPGRYGEPPHDETVGVREDRDAGELPLLAAALERDLPVLGICRGMQLMAVAHGGALVQHLPDLVGHDDHRPRPGVFGRHGVRLAPDSVVGQVLGERVDVPSYHHQGLASPGSLTVTGWADDETPEVVEDPGRRFAVGVLWHPEADTDPRLFEALVAAV